MKDLTLEDMTKDELIEVIRERWPQPTAALLKEIRLKRLMEAAHQKSVQAAADMKEARGVENHVAFMAALQRSIKADKEWSRLSKLRYSD